MLSLHVFLYPRVEVYVQLQKTEYNVTEGEQDSVSVCAEVVGPAEEDCPVSFSFDVHLAVGKGAF